MNIYLKTQEGQWKLYDDTKENLKSELVLLNIQIEQDAQIGRGAQIRQGCADRAGSEDRVGSEDRAGSADQAECGDRKNLRLCRRRAYRIEIILYYEIEI
jgi:hypothetical protein